MKNVMTKAWEIAREGQKKFGGKVSEYFVQALSMAWVIVKKQMEVTVHTWKNEKGMTFELHSKHVTEQESKTDWGDVIKEKTNFVMIYKFLVNGKNIPQAHYISRKEINGMKVLDVGVVEWEGRKVKMAVVLPQDIEKAVWGEYDAIESSAREARQKKERKRAARI